MDKETNKCSYDDNLAVFWFPEWNKDKLKFIHKYLCKEHYEEHIKTGKIF